MVNRLAWWIPAVVYGVLIFWFSHQGQPPGVNLGPDYLLHFLAYGLLGLLVVVGITRGLRVRMTCRMALWAWGIVLAYSLLDEFHQSFIPGRTADLADVFADGLGGLLAVVSLALLQATVHPRRSA